MLTLHRKVTMPQLQDSDSEGQGALKEIRNEPKTTTDQPLSSGVQALPSAYLAVRVPQPMR